MQTIMLCLSLAEVLSRECNWSKREYCTNLACASSEAKPQPSTAVNRGGSSTGREFNQQVTTKAKVMQLRINNECLREYKVHPREDVKYPSDSTRTVKGDIMTLLRIIVGAGAGWVGSGEERRASAAAKEEEEEMDLVVWPPADENSGSSRDAVAFDVAADLDEGQVLENNNKATTMTMKMKMKKKTGQERKKEREQQSVVAVHQI